MSLEGGKISNFYFKVAVSGRECVGKTSILLYCKFRDLYPSNSDNSIDGYIRYDTKISNE